ncbi:hypothetical protein FRC12_006886 [Ceratobasidium sp. 428]|nr:hypothetical protein FRC12_006886 [Ceratobasidium sp. 428]
MVTNPPDMPPSSLERQTSTNCTLSRTPGEPDEPRDGHLSSLISIGLPPFPSENSAPPTRLAVGCHRSVSDPVGKRVQPNGHRNNPNPEQLLPVDALTQTRNYYGPSATSRKVLLAGFEERRAKIVAERRRGVETMVEMTEEEIMNAVLEDKRRANIVAARRSWQRKLEYVKNLEDQLAEANEAMEMWKARVIAAEGMLKEMQARSS